MRFTSTEHPISWFRDRYRDGSLTIKPPYQRKPVWTLKQKCYLIESILLDLPVPEIYIQHTTSPKGETTYAIVDGQQRVRTMLQFVGAEKDSGEMEFNRFSLDKLPDQSSWKNATFEELDDGVKKKFYGHMLGVRYLQTESDEEVRDMFRRVNKYLTPLKPQELRNATYTGPFAQLALKLADNEYWVENRIVTPAAIRRMSDVEFVSELLIGVLHGPQAGSAKVIDEYYSRYEDFEDEFPEQKKAESLFKQTFAVIQRMLPDIKGRRWANKTDFYTLFVACAALLRDRVLVVGRMSALRKDLNRFADEIGARLADEDVAAARHVVQYVRAVEKGANDKARRAARQEALLKVLDPYFKRTG